MNTKKGRASKPGGKSKCTSVGADGAADKVYSVQPQESPNVWAKEGEEKTETGADLLARWLRRRWSEPRIRTILSERFPWHPLPTVTGSDFWILVARLPLTKTPAFWKWIEVRATVSAQNRQSLALAKARIFGEAGWHQCSNAACSVVCDRCGGLGWYRGDFTPSEPHASLIGQAATLIADCEDGFRFRVIGARHGGGEYLGAITGTLDQIEALLPWLAPDLRSDVDGLLSELRRPAPAALPRTTEASAPGGVAHVR